MARKKKKQKKKQKIQQRRATVAQKRRKQPSKKGSLEGYPGQSGLNYLQNALKSQGLSQDVIFSKMTQAMESEHLLDEPEFEDFLLPPVAAAEAIMAAATEAGLDLEKMAVADEEKRLDVLEHATRTLLTPKVVADIQSRLKRLRTRLGDEADEDLLELLDAIEFMLESRAKSHFWHLIGLIRDLVLHSFELGFEFIEKSAALLEEEMDEEIPDLSAFQQRLKSVNESELQQLVEENPALAAYVYQKSDEMWEQGWAAVFSGELVLNLFTPDELTVAPQIWEDLLVDEMELDDLSEQRVSMLVGKVMTYVGTLLTPERLQQLNQHLNLLLDSQEIEDEWKGFITLIKGIFQENNREDWEADLPLLAHTFMIETKPYLSDSELPVD